MRTERGRGNPDVLTLDLRKGRTLMIVVHCQIFCYPRFDVASGSLCRTSGTLGRQKTDAGGYRFSPNHRLVITSNCSESVSHHRAKILEINEK